MSNLFIGLYSSFAKVFGWTPAQVDDCYLDAIWELKPDKQEQPRHVHIDQLPGW